VNGRKIDAVAQITKQGFTYVFDRVTGKPVWPIEERPVPASDVPGERLSPTQPFPTKPLPYERLGYNEEDLIDFTPFLRTEALDIAKQYVRGPMYTPITRVIEGGTKGTWVNPGYGGGANWNGGAFDPETAMMYVPTRNQPMVAALTAADRSLTDFDYVRAATAVVPGPRGLKLDFDAMGQVGVRPSPLLTKTLLFLGESGSLSGDPGGRMFRAYDKATGAAVAEIELPSKATGAPMTYRYEGKQYIVVAVSTREHPAELVALSLPDSTRSQPAAPAGTSVPPAAAPPVARPDTPEIRNGRQIFATSCAICHGRGGEGVPGGPPGLTSVRDAAKVRQRVTKGGVQMPAMQAVLTEAQIHDVSEYVAAGLPPEPRQQ
jgi:quinoprotein glucose dehydrogenase